MTRKRCFITSTLDLNILYEDESCLVVGKPACIHSVELPGGKGGDSVAAHVAQKFPELRSASPKHEDCGLVQRLDFETSGVLLVAKNVASWQQLHEALGAGDVEKEYQAIVEGKAPPTRELTSWIGSKGRTSNKVRVFLEEPREAYRVLQGTSRFSLVSYDQDRDESLVRIVASPARRHQVRAHAGHLGFPLVGDEKYGSTRKLEGHGDRPFFLHAARIAFVSPATGKRVEVSCTGA